MRLFSLLPAFLAPLVALASPLRAALEERAAAIEGRAAAQGLPRLVIYFQTTHDQAGNPISMLPLVNDRGIALTHLIVCSLHVNYAFSTGTVNVHLNDFMYNDTHFDTLWAEAEILKKNKIKVMGMVGGAAYGSFTTNTLGADREDLWEQAYGALAEVIRNQGLQGIDLDVEQSLGLDKIERLVNRLAADFGPDFIITLAPVASALEAGGGNLSGFSYKQLEADDKDKIAFYNAQYYSGFGWTFWTNDFDRAVANGFSPDRIVIGQLTSPDNGYGYTDPATLNETVVALREKYGTIGGVMGWEYFNSAPGGTSAPWQWAEDMTRIFRPGPPGQLKINGNDVQKLNAAWHSATKGKSQPNVPYDKWKNSPP